MAGTFVVAERKGVSVRTPDFCRMVDALRPRLAAIAPAVLEEAYRPIEDGFDIVSVIDLKRDDFNAFCDAALAAYADEQGENSSDLYRAVWAEFLALLESDPRRTR